LLETPPRARSLTSGPSPLANALGHHAWPKASTIHQSINLLCCVSLENRSRDVALLLRASKAPCSPALCSMPCPAQSAQHTVGEFCAPSTNFGEFSTATAQLYRRKMRLWSKAENYAGFVPAGMSRSRTTSHAKPIFSISQIM